MTDCSKTWDVAGTKAMRATLIGIGAGYTILIALLMGLSPDASDLIAHNGPYLIIVGIALFLIAGPLAFPRLQKKWPITGQGLGKACAKQALAPQRVLGIAALGFVLGALLHQSVKLLLG